MWWLLGLAQLLAVGFVLATLAGTLFTAHRLLHPRRKTVAWAIARGVASDPSELDEPRTFDAYERALTDARGRTHHAPVWDIPGDDPRGPLVVYTPGWGDSRVGVLARLPALAPAASRIIAWDPPGLGDATGEWALGLHEPPLLAELVRQTARDAGTDAGPDVVLFGASAGAGVSIACAVLLQGDPTGPRVHAIIGEGAFRRPRTPARNVVRRSGLPWAVTGPLAFMLLGVRAGVGPRWRGYDRADLAARLRDTPLLLLHGDRDETCPLAEVREIEAAAPAPGARLAVIPGAGHNDLWLDPATARPAAERVRQFLRELREPPPR